MFYPHPMPQASSRPQLPNPAPAVFPPQPAPTGAIPRQPDPAVQASPQGTHLSFLHGVARGLRNDPMFRVPRLFARNLKQEIRGARSPGLPPPPLSLRQYEASGGRDPAWAGYLREVDQKLKVQKLDRFVPYMNDECQSGQGNRKDCYEIGDGRVLTVQERASSAPHLALAQMRLLADAGFPVVHTYRAGVVPSRTGHADPQKRLSYALVQEQLSGCYSLDHPHRDKLRGLVASPRLNRNTLESLLTLGRLIRTQHVLPGELEGGLRADGRFVLTNANRLERFDPGNPRHQQVLQSLDELTRAVRQTLPLG